MSIPTFDSLMALFDRDPVAFDRLREELIEQEIRSARPNYQRRLRGIQFQIDGIRQTAKNPLDCSVKIQRVLDKKLDELRYVVLQDHQLPTSRPLNQSNILQMKSKDAPKRR